MQANVGSLDKAVRLILALVLFSLYFVLEGNLRFLALVGFVPLLTGLVSWCPLYALLGLSTCATKPARQ
ncbi:MAG: DUF2892 domain-containing protein [candidate division KSB1 bacterium]|nr:DUF2892 domain-containing protein [candidate division KSB1 bacterium]MDZ7274581.1 DUF2892 domain-containing protein [candidate division KSB1 bacterium]MDZ7284758.1 DUF2892 domain-containing protein [candidate division KSB1 bacterium]MDZ7297822.1 DUF2892 domain-containing protein [candidate division KSB1 bacterium]MDZ7307786.1 DUF2892 domain-containing protein [candidate division KSB1 bacterium]